MSIANRLSLMMFLEYVIWGSWLPLLENLVETIERLKWTVTARHSRDDAPSEKISDCSP